MPLLKAVADKLSNNDLVAGVIEEVITRDELFALLPFVGVNGKAYVYTREAPGNEAAETLGFIAPNDSVPERANDFNTVTAVLKILAGDVDVDNFLQEVESDHTDQKATQIALKAKYLGRKFRNTLVNGNESTAPKEFNGLKKMVTDTGNTSLVAVNGGPLTLEALDALLDAVPHGADGLMMHSRTMRKVRALLRATGGTDASMIEIPNFGVPVFAYNGVPIIRNDFVSITESEGSGSNLSSIYALRLNELDGVHGLWGGADAGIRVEDVGIVQDKDATRTRLKWYCGAALKSTQSLARLGGIAA